MDAGFETVNGFALCFCSSDPTLLGAVKELSDYLVENGDLVFHDLSEALEKVSVWFTKSVGLDIFHFDPFVLFSIQHTVFGCRSPLTTKIAAQWTG